MDRLIKVFGERNTGTRAVLGMIDGTPGIQGVAHEVMEDAGLEPYEDMIRLVERQYKGPWKRVYREAIKDVRTETLGPIGTWKHAAPVYDSAYRAARVSVLFVIRNPYSWIASLYRRPYHNMGRQADSLPEFVSFPWRTVGRDNVERILPSPVCLWPLKVRAYRTFEAAAARDAVACAWLSFEDFVQYPVRSLSDALAKLNLPCKGLAAMSRPTKPRGRSAEERRRYYAREGWRAELCARSVAAINQRIDWTLAAEHGYARLDPAVEILGRRTTSRTRNSTSRWGSRSRTARR